MSDMDIRRFLKFKSIFEEDKFVSVKVVVLLLEHKLDYQLQIEELENKLIYALKTGGEYLETVKCLN